jgi:hypothetical protein
MPFDSACYVASVDKIFACRGPYVAQCSAVTGAIESTIKITGPSRSPSKICWAPNNGKLYIAIWNSQRGQHWDDTTWPTKDIWPIDPTSFTTETPLSVYTLQNNYYSTILNGPHSLFEIGTKLWINYARGSGDWTTERIDPSDTGSFEPYPFATPRDIGYGNLRFCREQLSTDGTYLYYPYSYAPAMARGLLSSTTMSSIEYVDIAVPDQGTITPMAAEWCSTSSKAYFVCGNEWLVRADDWSGADTYTKYNLNSIVSDCNPFHLRHSPVDSKIYIPSQGNDRVIVWDTSSETGIAKTGFDGPIDIVFTGTKAFAMQSGRVGLVEIV